MKRNKICLLFFVLLAVLYPSYSFSSSYYGHFEPLTIANGLNNNTTYNLSRSEDGFIWIATDAGISRFDGFRFRNYPFITATDGVMKPVTKSVSQIYHDRNGLLYLKLTQGGIACFDKQTEQYLSIRFNPEFDATSITSLYVADKEILYLATTTGLYNATVKWNRDSDDSSVEFAVNNKPLLTGSISNICSDDKGNIFFSLNKNKVMHYSMGTQQPKEIALEQSKEVSALRVFNDNLWICRKWSDIICYDFKRKFARTLTDTGGVNRPNIADTYITNITSADGQNYYLSSWAGLFYLQFDSKALNTTGYTIDCMTRGEKVCALVVESKMTDVLWDASQNVLWMGTYGGGIVKMALNEDAYSHVAHQVNMQVNGIEEDAKGYIWLATERRGILRSKTNTVSAATTFENWTKGVIEGENYQIYKDKNGSLWIADHHSGLVFINPITEETISYTLLPEGETHFHAIINQVCLDSREKLWVGTNQGLVLFDPKTEKSKIVLTDIPNLKEVYSITEDKEGNIWMGTNLGLKRLEIAANKITVVGEYEKKAGLAVEPVYYVYVNNNNQIFSSYADKIIRIDGRNKEEVEAVFTLFDGLANGHAQCMVDDGNGNTWVGSSSGIMTIRNDRSSFYHYFMSGFCNNVCRLRSGRLLWSNSWGLIAFDPIIAKNRQSKKQLFISDLWVNGASVSANEELNGQVVLTSSPESQKEFVFNAGSNDFSFYFSDMQYGMMQRKIAYRLMPDEEWKLCGLEEGIHFSHLAGGEYSLQVKLVYPDSSEGEVIEIPIIVNTPWWQTWWAYTLYTLIVAGLFAGAYQLLLKREKKRKLLIEELLQQERTKMRQMEHASVQNQAERTEPIPNLLMTRLMEELQMPLSLIIAPLKEIASEKNLQPELMSKMYVAYRNSIGLSNSVDHILGIYTHSNFDNALKVSPVFIEQFIDSFVLSMNECLRVHPIKFEYTKRVSKELEVWIDKKQIEFILHNLLSNAFLHVRYAGDILLNLEETKGNYTITVTDSGKCQVRPITQITDSETLFHTDSAELELGYDIMENIVHLHHGTISITSDKSETSVKVTLPTGDEILQNDPNVEFVDPEQEDESVLKPVEEEIVVTSQSPFQLEELPPITSSKNKKTILVIEDYNDIRLYLKVLFEREYNILLAENGEVGVRLAKKELPDLIICDVMMPVKDGFQCCREIKGGLDTSHIPFIILTAKVEDDDVMQGLEAGADDYILKPFTTKILKAKVRNLIQGRQRLKQMYDKYLVPADSRETPQEPEETAAENPFINSVIKIIEENIGEADFNVKKLASDMNMSQPTLYRKVKQITDYTIIELIRGVRMRKAAMLLKQKQYSVQEVAEMIGYNDIPTFRKHFVDAFGATPSTYAPEND